MADKKISELTALTGALNVADALPISDDSASATKKISPKALLEQGFVLIDAGSIPADKVASSGPLEIPDGSITAIKLADNSSGVVAAGLTDGIRVGQVGVDSTTGKFYVWDGSQWLKVKAAGSINELVFDGDGPIFVGGVQTDDSFEVTAAFAQTQGPGEFLAGPIGTGGDVDHRRIAGADLPIATSTEPGAVIVDGGGLKINGGVISTDSSVAATTNYEVVSYDANGLVTGGRLITGADLPAASDTEQGAVLPGNGLVIGPNGALSIDNSVTPGTHTKITYNSVGLVTQGEGLEAADVPGLPADKITSGEFPTERLADRSVTRDKLADYSIAHIQEVQPSAVTTPDHIGTLWYQESTGQLRMWNGNSWMPVGFGRLSNDNLRWGGIVDANTGLITGVTSSGTNAGLEIGQPLPEASNALGGLYVVISEAGDKITVTPGVTYDAGDWCLCINETEGWIRIDTMTGGSGGGGSSTLADLLDVTLTGASDGQYLQLAANGQWVNVDLTAGSIGALAPGDNVSELTNDAGYLDQAEVINILDGKNPDGTPNPSAPDYATKDDIGDGTIAIKKADGTPVGSFTVNQAGDTEILLPADVVPADPNLQAVLDAGNTSTTGLEIGDSGESIELKPTGVIEASSLLRVNTDAAAPREGVLINGDLAVNTGNYALRLHGGADLTSADYSIVGREASGITEIRAAGGWGENYFFGATTTFINISNDNGSGRPTPIPGAEAVVHVYNGLNTQFGTKADPLGNVMPKDDWSSIPSLT